VRLPEYPYRDEPWRACSCLQFLASDSEGEFCVSGSLFARARRLHFDASRVHRCMGIGVTPAARRHRDWDDSDVRLPYTLCPRPRANGRVLDLWKSRKRAFDGFSAASQGRGALRSRAVRQRAQAEDVPPARFWPGQQRHEVARLVRGPRIVLRGCDTSPCRNGSASDQVSAQPEARLDHPGHCQRTRQTPVPARCRDRSCSQALSRT